VLKDAYDRAAQPLGAVEDEERRLRCVKRALTQADQQVSRQGGVLGGALDRGEVMLALRPANALHVLIEHRRHHLQASADGKRQ